MSGGVKKSRLLKELVWSGFEFAPAQVFGGVRLVPLLRSDHRDDLRLSKTVFKPAASSVSLSNSNTYCSYIPHGLVASWNKEGGAVIGTQTMNMAAESELHPPVSRKPVSLKGMARRTASQELRFLPMHTAMEGYLSHHFGGPEIAWSEYRRETLKYGLGSRYEYTHSGRVISGLEDALRVFEIHENQIGMALFVSDSLAAVFVVPHPNDYTALHSTLLSDFYGEVIFYYGLFAKDTRLSVPSIDADRVGSFQALREEVDVVRRNWSAWHESQTATLFNRPIEAVGLHKFHPFTLQRFSTGFDPSHDNHIGECIVDESKTIQYLKTFRLSVKQCKRAYILSKLAEAEWNLDACAALLDCSRLALIDRLKSAGFGYLLHQHILDAKH